MCSKKDVPLLPCLFGGKAGAKAGASGGLDVHVPR